MLPSSLRNCPQCGQCISPKTASVVLFRELANGQGGQTEGRTPSGAANSPKTTKSNAPKRAAQLPGKRRKTLLWAASIAAVALLLTGETFLVKSIYANVTYRECLDLWNCGGSVAANKRTPDPVYEGTIEETPVDSLNDIDIRRAAQTDSIDRIEAIDESTPDSLAF